MKKYILSSLLFFSVSCTKVSEKYDVLAKNLKSDILSSEAIVDNILNETSSSLVSHLNDKGIYNFNKDLTLNDMGVVSNFSKNMKSNVYITKGTNINSYLKTYVARTDNLENIWEALKKNNSTLVTWLYTYHVNSNTMRIYPWVDMSKIVGSSIKWSLVTFFENYERVKEYQKKSFCTRPYDDLGGTGMNISCCRIVDELKKIEDVILTCADISLKPTFDKFRKSRSDLGVLSNRSILIESFAPEIAYKKQAKFDLATGISTYSNNFSENMIKYKKIGVFEILKINLYLEVE